MHIKRQDTLKLSGLLLILFMAMGTTSLLVNAQAEPAQIINDEGGAVSINGEVTYTNADFFLSGIAQPIIILEDQAGFVDRNRYFLMPKESQVMGQITSDFYSSPFTYSIDLSVEPQASLRDVDNDDETDIGVMVFAPAYWSNTWGDPFLEERDLFGGGWSSAYASTRVSEAADTLGEYIGGKIVIYAPDDKQEFPSAFGADGFLFTEDDPVVAIPQGYTVVDMDTDPFTFDRSRYPVIDLIEPEGAIFNDYSALSYTEAFDNLVTKMRNEYAFTEFKSIDWDALVAEFRPQVEAADSAGDGRAYLTALRGLLWSLPDGHVNAPLLSDGNQQYEGGIGLTIRELDNGRIVADYIEPQGPASQAGIIRGADILAINDQPIKDVVENTTPWLAPFSTTQNERLNKLAFAVRFPIRTQITITFRNPDAAESITAEMFSLAEYDSLFEGLKVGFGEIFEESSSYALPLEYRLLDSGYAYVKLYTFSDNDLLTIQLWERLMSTLNATDAPGLIVDMRENTGGSGFLADQMAAYFFDEPLVIGQSSSYDADRGEFYSDPRGNSQFYPPDDSLRYDGPVAVLIAPSCFSACEFFTYAMTIEDRASIVGQYNTGGLGGGITSGSQVLMPEGFRLQYPVIRPLDLQGNIIIEGVGIIPNVRVPVTEETVFSDGDPVLEAAVQYLDSN